ncbi:hypothetical protein A2773_01525 [Candidatus Gottesmanbacteria bacterium RIFCSPHIGHO2_01_FULL_39_10]|uniref:DUF5659 domain-containing protein n=1 Tax=Candidatus Gottesmanbacteria bacterium RIFCSPHIGHO2_01_FULL_39_10 TaxID=1798375 RepID=A0A1F5ZN64_9BACT|nr:MAG: hypothetical protein A2773_01525 [Candidatus Gottesmanbacteria bacterium RIFCSPHIGHO2_01_FULL_39_10]
MQNNNNSFVTKDLYLSALLYAKGVKLQKIDRQGRVCWFVFEDKSQSEQLRQKFITKSIDVNARDFTDALRTLKDLVFAES